MEKHTEMESRWHLRGGQTLENTKIEDRGHALHVTKNAWGKITGHLDRNRLVQEATAKEEAHKRALKEGSEEMTKNWDNSVQNITKRKEEARTLRLEKEHEDKMQRFYEMRKEQAIIREKFINDAKKTMYISKGQPKTLTSALIQAEVMFERNKQLELEKAIQEHETEEAAKYAQKVKEGVVQEKSEKLEAEKKVWEKKLEYREVYLTAMREKVELNKSLKEKRVAEECEDNINGAIELAQIKKYAYEEDREKKANMKYEFFEFDRKRVKIKEELATVDKEQDVIIDIYTQSKHEIHCLRKKKEQQIQEAMAARREVVAKQISAGWQSQSENEERIFKHAIEEKDKLELEKLLAKEIYKKQLLKERDDDRRNCMEREERRKCEENEWKKWEMLNRFKNNDVTVQYELDKKKKAWMETLEYRKDLFEQMAENDEEKRKKKQENDSLYENSIAKIKEDDKQFLDYANECYQYAKSRGRSTLPIERIINEYKLENNLPLNVNKPCENYDPTKS